MNAIEAPVGVREIEIGGTVTAFSDLYQPFDESEFAGMLLDRSRWGDFKPSWMPDDTYQRILGVDSNNFKHEILSEGLMAVFLQYCSHPPEAWGDRPVPDLARFTLRQEKLMRIGARKHDNGESTKGDTANPGKTQISEHEEFVELLRIENVLLESQHGAFGAFFATTFEHAKERFAGNFHGFIDLYRKEYVRMNGKDEPFGVIFEALDEMMFNPDSKLAKAFAVFEKAGYLRTAMRVWGLQQNADLDDMNDEMRERMRALTFSVLSNNFTVLIEAAELYPPILLQLVEYAPRISEAFETPVAEAIEELRMYQKYKPADTLKQQFERNKAAWGIFSSAYAGQIRHLNSPGQ